MVEKGYIGTHRNNELRDVVLGRAYSLDVKIEEVETRDIQEIIDSAQIEAAALLPEWFGVNDEEQSPKIIIENPFEADLIIQALQTTSDRELSRLIASASVRTNHRKSPLKPEIVVGLMKIKESKTI